MCGGWGRWQEKGRYLCRQSMYFFLPALLTLLHHLSVCRVCLLWQPNEQQIEKSLELSAKFDVFGRDLRQADCVDVCGTCHWLCFCCLLK